MRPLSLYRTFQTLQVILPLKNGLLQCNLNSVELIHLAYPQSWPIVITTFTNVIHTPVWRSALFIIKRITCRAGWVDHWRLKSCWSTRQVVIIVFTHVTSPSVSTLQNQAKQNKFQGKAMFSTCYGAVCVDHWWLKSFVLISFPRLFVIIILLLETKKWCCLKAYINQKLGTMRKI